MVRPNILELNSPTHLSIVLSQFASIAQEAHLWRGEFAEAVTWKELPFSPESMDGQNELGSQLCFTIDSVVFSVHLERKLCQRDHVPV